MTGVSILDRVAEGGTVCSDHLIVRRSWLLYEMMLQCWDQDSAHRPTFETLHWQLEEFYNLHDV